MEVSLAVECVCEAFESEHGHWNTRKVLIKLSCVHLRREHQVPSFAVLHTLQWSCSGTEHFAFCYPEGRPLFAVWKGLVFGK